jgi:hypothetical protein
MEEEEEIGIGGNLTAPPSHTTGHTAPAVGAGVRVRIRRFVKHIAVSGIVRSTLRRTFLRLVSETARPSRKIPAASPPSPSLQVPYPGKSAFFAHLSNCSKYSPRLTFGPSQRIGST